ncbi:MAG: hypothetical protein EA379_11680 [Phycisphaerales bacterium]|nr:MAG: hypothetical protein EA379_11680 [Phycisphaerales bacterium]
MGSRFSIQPPADYLLTRDVCSYGYFLLAPNRWDPDARALVRPLDLDDGPATLTIAQPDAEVAPKPNRPRTRRALPPGTPGAPLRILADRALSRREIATAKRRIARMLQLDDAGVSAFHRADPRWKSPKGDGRARLFRSPTFFEDLVKTVTSCNVAWPSTVRMNQRLCEVVNPAFPRPEQLARRRASTLRARCGVGYRDKRLVELASLVARREADPAWFEDESNSDDDVFNALLRLPGIGPYAAGNVMQLLGRYSRLAIDTESVRHGREVLGMTGEPKEIERALAAHYEPFGAHKFRSYWFEVWAWYESRRGPAWTWEASKVGSSFTAAAFRADDQQRA